MKLKHTLLWWLYLILHTTSLSAQPSEGFSNVTYLTSDNGLSHGEVTCIIQDQAGFLWVGTRGGLNRYNGYQFDIFKNEIGNPNSLINNSVESLFEDSRGRIWIGTKSSGASCYDPGRDRFTHYQSDNRDTRTISGNRIVAIAEAPDGDIWLGTWDNGFSILDAQTSSFTRHLPGVQVSHILQDSKGDMWLGTNRGLLWYDKNGEQLGQFTHGQSPGDYETLIEDPRRNCIWIGTWQNGLLQFDLHTQTFRQFRHDPDGPYGPRANITYTLLQDQQDRIWVGTWGSGLFLFDPGTRQFSRHELATGPYQNAGRLYSEILDIYQDRSGVIWIATNGGGICKVNHNDQQFGLLKGGAQPGSALPSYNPIWSLLQDHQGTLWLGTKGNGFLSYSQNGRPFQTIDFPQLGSDGPRSGNKILGGKTIFERRDSSLWVGTHHGLYRIQQDEPKRYRLIDVDAFDGQPVRGIKISCMTETADGSFWIGTQQSGLNRVRQEPVSRTARVDHYRVEGKPTALQNERISALLEDGNQRLWVGTYGGLHLYQPEGDQFRVFNKVSGDLRSLSSNIIICLHEDRRGRLWIGTPNGLNLAVPDSTGSWRFRSFQEADGLPNNYIHAILEDDRGNLWISTNKGITRFDPDQELFYNYDVNDGLQGNSFSEGAACRGQDGTLYFGGIYGLNYFHPDSIGNDPIPPPVFITGFKIFNKEVEVGVPFNDRLILERTLAETEQITLNHRENVFTLEFTALNLQMPHKNTYRYRLIGLEEDWNEVGGRRNVTYTNLPPGNYTFEVSAANNNQFWEDHVASLQIRVLPPFWATWQAYLIYALLLAGLFGLYHQVTSRQNLLKRKLELARVEREKEAEVAELKTRFFTNITHELRTPLTLIKGPVEELLDQQHFSGKAKNYLFNIHHHTQRLLALVNQLLDFRKAETGNMQLQAAEGNFVAFAREVFLSFQPMAEKRQIDFQFRAQPEELQLYFDRDKMEIVLCNLLSNAFKYTPDGHRIEVSIRKGQCASTLASATSPADCCEISIRDNGIGMPKELADKIFDRFYQIANTESMKMVGTGIGLALVESIVHLHHGRVEVEAEAGQGSQFTVHLPAGKQHLSPQQIIPDFRGSDDSSHYRLEQATVKALKISPPATTIPIAQDNELAPCLLIVEDNPKIRQFIRSIFADEYRIIEAANGKEGLELAKTGKPKLVISDVMMPEMDGIEFCRRLKKSEATCHLPLIMLTARTANVFQVEGFQSGADAYVTKPFQPSVLKAQVAAMLEARRKLRAYFSHKVTLQPSDIEITSEDEAFIKKAVQVVEENLDNEALGKDFLAHSLAMSPSSLYRRIKSTTDLSINAFIRSIRLRRAAQLIQKSQYNISEISYQVGFNDLKYFRKCFREQFGKNPSEFAEQPLAVGDGERG